MPRLARWLWIALGVGLLVAALALAGGCGAGSGTLDDSAGDAGARTGGGSIPDGAKVEGHVYAKVGVSSSAPVQIRGSANPPSLPTIPGSGTSATTPASGIRVTLGMPDGGTLETYADSNGKFEFAAPYQGQWPLSFELASGVRSTTVDVAPLGGRRSELLARFVQTGGTAPVPGALVVSLAQPGAPSGPSTALRATDNGVEVTSTDIIWTMETLTDATITPAASQGVAVVNGGTITGSAEVRARVPAGVSNTLTLSIAGLLPLP